MTEKKLIHFNSDSDYQDLKNDIDGSSIVFVKDSHKIATHDAEYLFLGWSILEPLLYEWVDLGLPSGLKWAARNVGAEKPEDFGLYFAWGETEGYSGITDTKKFGWSDYKLCDGSSSTLTKYNYDSSFGVVDNLTTLELEDDAAHISDNTCRMPTKSDFEELMANTTSTWETLNGVNGRRLTSNTNGNSIFIPAAGHCTLGSGSDVGSIGLYWSSSLNEKYYPTFGWSLYFHSDLLNIAYFENKRYLGFSVRAVKS